MGKDEIDGSISPLSPRGIADLKDAAPGAAVTVFIFGHIDYCDIFGRPHSTAYCVEYKRGMADHLPRCDRYNGEIPPRATCTKPRERL